ncbi:MAG: SEC-C metal-binding domain-containing protein [Bacillota bacterium]
MNTKEWIELKTIGRNDRCSCGSGKKYKNCCLNQEKQINRSNKEDNRVIPFPGAMKGSDQKSLSFKALRSLINQELEWKTDAYRELADKLFPELAQEYRLKDDESVTLLYSLLMIWNEYSNELNPKFRKPGGYAGALEYLMTNLLGVPATQSEMAAKHHVSTATLGNAFAKIYDYMAEADTDQDNLFSFMSNVSDGHEEDFYPSGQALYTRREMEEQMFVLTELVNQQNFQSQEEMENFINASMQNGLNQQALPKSDVAQARELLLNAERERNPVKRIQLARKANKLDPGNADAYEVLAQEANTLAEALTTVRTGLKNVENSFGVSYFTENKGYFWGLIETRPYMRLKHFYMYLLREDGDDAAAIREAEEMLELCPNDNIGVRYELLMLYLLRQDFKAAKRLLETYPENRASFTYDRMVMEYLQHGITPKLSSYKEAALQANAFVPAYLYGKKKLPRHMPEYIGFGDENEAMEYVGSHTELWFRPEMVALVEWMKKGSNKIQS